MKILFLLFLMGFQVNASVWKHDSTLSWDKEWDKKYADWISTKVEGNFFKKLGRPYSRIKMDCADTQYALSAFFARKHKLPFAVNKGDLTNETTRFDHIKNLDKRFSAFVNYMRANFGTESLSHHDSYPIAIKSLLPGDVFMYKVGSSGRFTRHTYIIKNINPDGTFDVLYSTQANAARNGALFRKPKFMFKKYPRNRGRDFEYWGFRRMKPSHLITYGQREVPGASFQQYRLAESLSAIAFFNKVQKINMTIEESPQMLVTRKFSGICDSLKDRVKSVKETQSYLRKTSRRCMNFGKYDAYSTPSRDSGIRQDYTSFNETYRQIITDGHVDRVRRKLWKNTTTTFDSGRMVEDKLALYKSCPINFGPNLKRHSTDMGTFRDNLFDGLVSFHPNDSLLWRWGAADGKRTRCKEFYGYPTD